MQAFASQPEMYIIINVHKGQQPIPDQKYRQKPSASYMGWGSFKQHRTQIKIKWPSGYSICNNGNKICLNNIPTCVAIPSATMAIRSAISQCGYSICHNGSNTSHLTNVVIPSATMAITSATTSLKLLSICHSDSNICQLSNQTTKWQHHLPQNKIIVANMPPYLAYNHMAITSTNQNYKIL